MPHHALGCGAWYSQIAQSEKGWHARCEHAPRLPPDASCLELKHQSAREHYADVMLFFVLATQSQLSDLFFATLTTYTAITHLLRVTQLAACDGDATYIEASSTSCSNLLSAFPCHDKRTGSLLYVLTHISTVFSCLVPGEVWALVVVFVAAVWMLTAAASSNYGSLAAAREWFSFTLAVCIKTITIACLLTVSK